MVSIGPTIAASQLWPPHAGYYTFRVYRQDTPLLRLSTGKAWPHATYLPLLVHHLSAAHPATYNPLGCAISIALDPRQSESDKMSAPRLPHQTFPYAYLPPSRFS